MIKIVMISLSDKQHAGPRLFFSTGIGNARASICLSNSLQKSSISQKIVVSWCKSISQIPNVEVRKCAILFVPAAFFKHFVR